nr:serine hydrolase domain-containing protein [Paenibacillus planticolens]
MRQEPLDQIDAAVNKHIQNKLLPGAEVLVARSGTIVKQDAYGYAYQYEDGKFKLASDPVVMKKDTIFDVASVSKIFTSTAVLKLLEDGLIHSVDDPVINYIPEFAKNGKEKVTIKQLLTHTSGFVSWIPLWGKAATREDTFKLVLEYKLDKAPGTNYTYSDLNMITLGVIVERLTGKRLDAYVKEIITDPLGMHDTMYNPPASLKSRIAATEYQPGTNRAIVWGEVHDENAYALGGVAGHAGVFSTAHDLAILGHTILNDGKYGDTRILKPETVKLMKENHLPNFPENKHSLAFELNLGWYMDALNDAGSLGHTGFTGTSIVLSPTNDTILILLTNRVHPSRDMGSINPVRRDVARLVGDSIKIAIPGDGTAWFSGYGDNVDNVLQAEVNLAEKATLSFDTIYSIQTSADYGYIEATPNGTTWTQIRPALNGDSQGWRTITVEVPAGTKSIRFRYKTVGTSFQGSGRGWYIQNVKVTTSTDELTPELASAKWQIRMY